MEYSPKLKKAIEEIKAVLSKHDIAGIICLHTPGHSEYYMGLSPSYSCCKVDWAKGEVRVRAKLLEDFGGDKKAWERKISDTANMLQLLSDTQGRTTLTIMDLAVLLNKKVNAEHSGGEHSTHIQQNN